MPSLIIRNGRLVDPASGTDRKADVIIDGEKVCDIVAAGTAGPSGAEVIDATGLVVTPGLIDMHVHLREPGEEYKEDIASGSAAAVFGGFSSIVAMPNTKPVIDNAELVDFVHSRGRQVGLCRVLVAGAVTAGQGGETLAPYGEMRRAGAVALTDDGLPVQNPRLMRSALEYSRDFGLPILTHAEEKSLTRGAYMHEGAVSTRLGLPGMPRIAEDAMVARDIMLAQYTGGRLHVCHVSTAGAVDLVRDAKARGVAVTAEGAPHHFTLTDAAVEGFDTHAKMYPPLREETDRQAVIQGLVDGTLDAIATDHAPHSSIEKDVAFAEAANGILGLQTALPLSLALVRSGKMDLMQLVERLTWGPARVLGLPYGKLAVGGVADVTIIDPDATWTFHEHDILSKSVNSPFIGRPLVGRAAATVVGGKIVYRH